MKRLIFEQLREWKNRKNRKPLILKGARQVGKSYIVEQFAKESFGQYLRIDFLLHDHFFKIFNENQSLEPAIILEKIAALTGLDFAPSTLAQTLLFLDEIQECPGAITSLKFFCEKLPELSIVATGSYLGIMANQHSFPVGKVEYIALMPMNFEEFLLASDPTLFKFYEKIDIVLSNEGGNISIDEFYHERLLNKWKDYLMIGGMPEVVKTYLKNINLPSSLSSSTNPMIKIQALRKMREIQEQLLEGYRSDFSKYAGKLNATHILHVFNSIPNQLSKSFDENVNKYKFTGVIPRHKGFESVRGPLTWLSTSRLVIKSFIAKKSHLPLSAYTEENNFKLFYHDIGLLMASLKIPVEQLLLDEVGHYKGPIAENFVATELFSLYDDHLYSWSEGLAEVEFLINSNQGPIACEVKSSAKFRRSKSLDSFVEKYHPSLALKISTKNLGHNKETKILSLPFYLLYSFLNRLRSHTPAHPDHNIDLK